VKKSHLIIIRLFWLSYLLLNMLTAIFYSNAFFWKGITNFCGKVWLGAISILILGLLLYKKQHKFSAKLVTTCISFISCIQVLAMFWWIVLSDGRHTFIFASTSYLITPVGAMIHAVILFLGVLLLYFARHKVRK
jgi:hypothetical protein